MGFVLSHSKQSCCLQLQHPIQVSVCLASPVKIQLSVMGLGKVVKDGPNICPAATYVGDRDEACWTWVISQRTHIVNLEGRTERRGGNLGEGESRAQCQLKCVKNTINSKKKKRKT